jgi:hypothetical protein
MEAQEYEKKLADFLKEIDLRESNRLIAEFMGKAPYINKDGRYEYMVAENAPISSTDLEELWYHIHKYFTFDHDWNSLMEVVEKINGLNNIVEIKENMVRVVNNERGEVLVDVVSGSMKEAIYDAVVEYIKIAK